MSHHYLTSGLLMLACVFGYACVAQDIEIGNARFSKTSFEISGGQPSVLAGDFNADGFEDIVIASYSENNITFFQGNGKGKLTKVGQFYAGERPTGLAASDIDGDGYMDLVVANHETNYVTFLYGNGKGQFKHTEKSKLTLNINPHPHHVLLEDLDNDQRVDLIVDSRDRRGLLVLYGLGNGVFKTPGNIIKVDGDPYRGFAIRDINRDGRLDLVTPNQNEVGILINDGTSNRAYGLRKLPQPEAPFSVALAEMSGDGMVDLIVATNGSLVTIYRGDEAGNFSGEKKTQVQTMSGAKQIVTGDINGDGIEDALISNWSGDLLTVLGGKQAMAAKSFRVSEVPNPWGVALTDLNGDGKDDLIIANGAGKSAALYISQAK